MGQKQFCEIEGCGYANVQSIAELIEGAFVNAFEKWQSVVYQIVHVPVIFNDFLCEYFKSWLVRNVALEVVVSRISIM